MAMVAASLQFIFLYLLRPLIIQKLRYTVFAQRDNLRLLALAGEIPQTDRAYSLLESRLNVCVRAMGSIDLADILMFRPTRTQQLEAAQSIEIINDSIAEVRSAYDKSIQCILAAIVLNSPILFLILPIAMFSALFYGRVRSSLNDYKAKAWTMSATPGLCPA